MSTTILGGGINMTEPTEDNIKRVKVSSQRQISIPKEFYDSLNISDEAYIEFTGKSIIIRPITAEVVDFSEYILRDLINEGYTGEKLITKFKEIKTGIPYALNEMIHETEHEPIITGNLDEYLDSIEIGEGDE